MAKSLLQNFLSLILLLLPWHLPHLPGSLSEAEAPGPWPPGRDPARSGPACPDGATSLADDDGGREGILMQGATGDRLCWYPFMHLQEYGRCKGDAGG